MISLKVLSTAAVMALVLPMVVPSESFAAPPGAHGARGGGSPGARFSGGGGPRSNAGIARGPRFSGNPGGGGNWHGGGGGRNWHRGGGGGFIPGAIAGAVIGGALASQSYGYYDPGYGDQYYDDGAVAVAPVPVGDDAVAYCMQTYRSYDPQSGTYLGYDGYRHPCP